jgi:hypothetical protein
VQLSAQLGVVLQILLDACTDGFLPYLSIDFGKFLVVQNVTIRLSCTNLQSASCGIACGSASHGRISEVGEWALLKSRGGKAHETQGEPATPQARNPSGMRCSGGSALPLKGMCHTDCSVLHRCRYAAELKCRIQLPEG